MIATFLMSNRNTLIYSSDTISFYIETSKTIFIPTGAVYLEFVIKKNYQISKSTSISRWDWKYSKILKIILPNKKHNNFNEFWEKFNSKEVKENNQSCLEWFNTINSIIDENKLYIYMFNNTFN